MIERIWVLDAGGGAGESVARKLRGEKAYAEVVRELPADVPECVRGLILTCGSGCDVPEEVLRFERPVLALGEASASLATVAGGNVAALRTINTNAHLRFENTPLFSGMTASDRFFDKLYALSLPESFSPIATLEDGSTPAFADPARGLYALQFLPESNDPDGLAILNNFAFRVCGISTEWTVEEFVARRIEKVRDRVGDEQALVTISGGVDSAVCAVLMHRAIRDNLKCLFIDTGLMRMGEPDFVENSFRDDLGIDVIRVDASEKVLRALVGLTRNDDKRRAVERVLAEVYAEEAEKLGEIRFIARGTIYSDVLNYDTRTETIDPDRLIEPIRTLFKSEVRQAGECLGMPADLLHRPSFPGPGFAVRCVGEVTREKLAMVRAANAIFRDEMIAAGQDRRAQQFFVVLTDTTTLSDREGAPSPEYAVVLRAMTGHSGGVTSAARLPYDLLERVCRRITTEVPGINRVLYDVSCAPPARVEWE